MINKIEEKKESERGKEWKWEGKEMNGKIEGKKNIRITFYINSLVGEVAYQSFYWKKYKKIILI